MKRRRRRINSWFSYKFREVDTSEFVVIRDLDEIDKVEVEGKFVKVAPIVRTVEVDSVDGGSIQKRLKERGARSVVIAPKIVSIGKEAVIEKSCQLELTTLRKMIDKWFTDNDVYFKSDDIRDRVRDRVLYYLENNR